MKPSSSPEVTCSFLFEYVTILLARAPAICLTRTLIFVFSITTELLSFFVDDFGFHATKNLPGDTSYIRHFHLWDNDLNEHLMET